MENILKIAIIGLGNRGRETYGAALTQLPEKAKIVAVAEILPDRLEQASKEFNLPKEMCFESAEEFLKHPKMADAVLVCTQDQQHVAHAIPALELGYDVLLEKPISPSEEDCRALLETAHRTGRKVIVCHVLRYSPFYRKIKEILDSGILGELRSIQAIENVCYWHQAHSFVRGNWRNSKTTSPMILAKCCHDMDLMVWLTGKRCERVSSFGSLSHFKPECAPNGAAKRCLDGCLAKESCPYDAEKIYIQHERLGIKNGNTDWPICVLSLNPTVESVYEAIKTGPYGRCVYHCDNDVVDHQVVNMEMEGGLTINFTMTGFTAGSGRYTIYMGTHGSMVADMSKNTISVTPFGKSTEVIDFNLTGRDGHGGGDSVLIEEFLEELKNPGHLDSITSIDASMESHFIAFAAEASRLSHGKCIEMSDIR